MAPIFLDNVGGNIVLLTQLYWPTVHPALQEERAMTLVHNITVERVPSSCGTRGHTDIQVKCSCGKLDDRLHHGHMSDAGPPILVHRIWVLEQILGVRLKVDYSKGL